MRDLRKDSLPGTRLDVARPFLQAFNKALLDLLQVETATLSRIRRKFLAQHILVIAPFGVYSRRPPIAGKEIWHRYPAADSADLFAGGNRLSVSWTRRSAYLL